MAPASLVRLVVAALAVVALASCSDDAPEPVATGGGLALPSTTTEQPRATEPRETTTSTTSSTSSTTTTSTTTTTTAPEPAAPTVEELIAALPAPDALPGAGWTRSEAPTEAGSAPGPLCEGSTVATPLRGVVAEVSIAGGVSARYDRADGRSTVQLVVAPLADGAERLAEAQAEVAACTGVSVLTWPTLGDATVAFAQPATAEVDGTTWAIAQAGPVVVGVNLRSAPADGTEAEPPPDEAALQAFVQAAISALPGTAAPQP